ncbi:MAG: DUF58 domain-containing protein [Hellea sp.]|nr:DUF58 domain-containing protein [Hellea sp.]
MARALKKHTELRRRSERLAASYPELLAEAERVAAIVAQGVHGRRRAGQGETFWQFRNYHSSDPAASIDWRRSARGDQVYVRQNEWEAANTVFFWRDGNPGMNWASKDGLPTKKDRGSVLCMALASLLLRGGERCAVLGESERPRAGRLGLERIAKRLAESGGPFENLSAKIPAHAQILIVSDFLEDPEVWKTRLSRLAGRPVKATLLRLMDPAERLFPYKGRVEMKLPGAPKLQPFIIGRAERARVAYQRKFEAHGAAIEDIARRLGWPIINHQTDASANLALTSLYMAINGEANQ